MGIRPDYLAIGSLYDLWLVCLLDNNRCIYFQRLRSFGVRMEPRVIQYLFCSRPHFGVDAKQLT